MKLAGIILAAGYSSRMHAFKPLLNLGGMSCLARCVRLFAGFGVEDILVVTGHRAGEVAQEAVDLPCRCVHNPCYDIGMYGSIKAGVEALAKVDAFFLLPVDIPLVRSDTLCRLATGGDTSAIRFPVFDGQRGHPPLIPARHIPQIIAYDGSGGLRTLLEQLPGRDIPVWDRSILCDMDSANHYHSLQELFSRRRVGTREEAMALARLVMPPQGVAHGMAVAEVASALGTALAGHSCILDSDILYNGGLLHDIAKGQEYHEQRGATLLASLGLTALHDCVADHKECAVPEDGRITESQLICLADKLVIGSRRVPITERFAEKLKLYSGDHAACQAIRRRRDKALSLQKRVERCCGQPLQEILAGGGQ